MPQKPTLSYHQFREQYGGDILDEIDKQRMMKNKGTTCYVPVNGKCPMCGQLASKKDKHFTHCEFLGKKPCKIMPNGTVRRYRSPNKKHTRKSK